MARASKPDRPKEQSLREFSRRAPNEAEWEEILSDILNAHDRAAAIIMAARVESRLQQLLLACLPNGTVELFLSPGGPLSGFYAKNHMAFALGIISKSVLEDLEIIRRIRNAFAHAPAPMKFSDPQIMKECQKLSSNPIHAKRERANQIKDKIIRKLRFELSMIDVTTERGAFLLAANEICTQLITIQMERENARHP